MRAARQRRRVSRKRLAELSAVSQRHLAMLECGDGNISLALLHRIALALEADLAGLVGGEGGEIAALYRAAGAAERERALDVLTPDRRRRRIALIGLRGAGKSTLGRRLADALGLPFVELNREIESQSGVAVNEVMALYGLEGYRRLERRALESVAADRLVLAVAGGLVTEPETFAYLRAHFHTVWLKATPEEHMHRVRAQGDERPMAGNPKAMEELNALLRDREALYASAAATVDTCGRGVADSEADLLRAVRAMGLG